MEPNLFRYIWQNSRPEQLFVLGLILCSLPFYWLSLDIPKRIVNEAIQGRAFTDGRELIEVFQFSLPLPEALGGTLPLFGGFSVDQVGYLFTLSGLFLFFVLINGGFKYVINISKGILAERMLRRMRFELFNRLMRFRPEQVRAVKPAEAASMINNEVEPIGGFIGDAFIQPAFLGTQALTALLFIMVQSVWLGLVALFVVLIQAFIIPYLRREQLRLARMRQIASRRLAGRIGEMVDGASTIHAHGLKSLSEAEIGSRLGNLFDIRAALYKRKFAVKYLNNLLAQITPFFFYAIGGYLALRGTLDIGQLVAVIAAYRDLPPPIKELIDWDQRRADVSIKYEQVISQFSSQVLVSEGKGKAIKIADEAPIRVSDLTVTDQRNTPLVSGLTLTIPRPSTAFFVGPSSSGRDIAVRVLARQITRFEGRAEVGNLAIADLPDEAAAKVFAYVPPDPEIFSGSIRENVTISLRRTPPPIADTTTKRWRETVRSGNPMLDDEGDWTDYAAAGVDGTEALERAIVLLLEELGMGDDLYGYGLKSPLPSDADDALKETIVAARHELRARLAAEELDGLVAAFDVKTYNPHATIGENLLFGVISGQRLATATRASDSFFRAILAAEAIESPLVEIGLRIAETSIEIFSDLPSGHPLFERFSMIKSAELDDYRTIVDRLDASRDLDALAEEYRNRLLQLALDYVEPRHRLGLITPELETRVLRARTSFRRYLPSDYQDDIEFYDAEQMTAAAPMQDNLLFGRIAQNAANAEKRIATFLREALSDLELDGVVFSLGLDYQVGPRGQALFAEQRAVVSLARALIRRPDVLILEDALKTFAAPQQEDLLAKIKARMADKTLVATMDDVPESVSSDQVISFSGARGEVREGKVEKPDPSPHELTREPVVAAPRS